MTDHCAEVEAVIDEVAAGTTLPPELASHLEGCAACVARLALARQIERVLVGWPAPAPPPHFAATVAARVRERAWRQEVVVDWGFNLALAASLVLIVGGAGAFLWLLGAQAEAALTSSPSAIAPVADLLARLRGQMPVVGTATVLLVTAAGAWWWTDERQRW